MRLTKYGHACVRLESGDQVLVIDPGVYSDPACLSGATAVLVTHEHADHVDAAALAAHPDVTVYTHPALAPSLGAVPVEVGDSFTAAGFAVRVVGGRHAEIIDGLPGCANVGYIVDGVYHPGDSLFVPAEPVDTLLVPASGPWVKLGEVITFAREVRPARAFPIHDVNLSEIGQSQFDEWLDETAGTAYARIPLGASADLA
ncbi:MBL fold metallo-hydrolase [Dactylosporangium maewongense]|uniref:MBL fold metallo-hydrolase n=1 Tax=Dactylosporangium maewongense TaxID=634393 RepID=A0ABN2B6V5_9ACTN